MQVCECTTVKTVKVEADFGADALWCGVCLANIESTHFSLTEHVITALDEWISDYGEWIDLETDAVVVGGVALEARHNERGAALTELVKQQLPQYHIVFSPSTYAVRYGEV